VCAHATKRPSVALLRFEVRQPPRRAQRRTYATPIDVRHNGS